MTKIRVENLSLKISRRSLRLLDMEYKLREIADELDAKPEQILVLIANGAPAFKDEFGHYWIHGLTFYKWLQKSASRNKKDKRAFALDETQYVIDNSLVKYTDIQREKTMINRSNYHLVKEHLVYREKVVQNDPGTISTHWQSLKHLLKWAGTQPFRDAQKIFPSFPEYLLTARNDEKNKQLTPKYMQKTVAHARVFFNWLKVYQQGYSRMNEGWIKTLVIKRSAGVQSRLQERHYYRLSEVEAIAALKPQTLKERRAIAAISFLFLSGMRIGAFVTLPVSCVDMECGRIEQLPEKGVHTKNSKAAITFLVFSISDKLTGIVKEWDKYIRAEGVFNWYPAISMGDVTKKTLTKDRFSGKSRKDYQGRTYAFSEDLKVLCKRADVEYKSPHKLRHGFGVWGVKHAHDLAELKAISQNMMHSSVGITDGIYGKLAEDELFNILDGFGKRKD